MKYKRVVVKVGTTTLTYENGKLNLRLIEKLARVLTDLRNTGIDIVLVSSGAIAVGASRLGVKRPRDTKGKQAMAAVGQGILMQIYEKIFMEYNQTVGQILLTRDVIDMPISNENAKNTFNALLELNVIPIVNENDTVAVDELGFSDNDTLSAYVATLCESDLLVILSDIDGLYDGDPNINSEAKIIPCVNEINEYIKNIAKGSNTELGTGGMSTKILAGEIAMDNNISMVIASGAEPEILYRIIHGEYVGTMFCKL